MGIYLAHTLALIGFLPAGYAGNGYPLPSLIICVLKVGCIKADTTILVGAPFILGDRVKCIPIYLVPFESRYSRKRQRTGNECMDI